MVDIFNLTKETLIRLLEKVEIDFNYIINNYSLDDRLKLFTNLMTNEELYDFIDDDEKCYKLILSILTYDEIDIIKKIDIFKDDTDIDELKILLGPSLDIASKLLEKGKSKISIYMIFSLPTNKKEEILKILRNNISNILDEDEKNSIIDDIVFAKDIDEFNLLIKKLSSKNIIKILENYPNIISLYVVLDVLDDEYKENIINTIDVSHRSMIIRSIQDPSKKYELALKYLNNYELESLIRRENSELLKLKQLYRCYFKLGEYDLRDIILTFSNSENIYSALIFLDKHGIDINSLLSDIKNKLSENDTIKIIDLMHERINYDILFDLIKKLSVNEKYEYILKFKDKFIMNYINNDIVKISINDFKNKKIDEEKFVNVVIEILKNETNFDRYLILYIIDLLNMANKLKMIKLLGKKLFKEDIIEIIKKLDLNPQEKLDLIVEHNLYEMNYNEIIGQLPETLRLEYLKRIISKLKFYKINEEEINIILNNISLKSQISILELLYINSKIKLSLLSKINLNLNLLNDNELLEILNRVDATNLKFLIALNIKNDEIRYNLFKNMYIFEFDDFVNLAMNSFNDKNIKLKFLKEVSNRRGLKFIIKLLDTMNLDLNYLENMVERNRYSQEYTNMIHAIIISKFDDKLKLKFFDNLDVKNDELYFKLLLESFKFNDISLDYSILKNSICNMFYSKQFEPLYKLDNNVLSYYFTDIEIYYLNTRKSLNIEDKKLLDDSVDLNNLVKEKIDYIVNIINKVNNSNCLEIVRLGSELKPLLFQIEEPFKKIKTLEKIFLRNKLPFGAKLYEVFEILHPNFTKFSGTIYSKTLNDEQISIDDKYKILLEDMIKISFLSAPKQGLDYLNEMQYEIDLLRKLLYIKIKGIKYEELDEVNKQNVNNILNIANSWSFIFKFQEELDLSVVYSYLNEDMIKGIENWIVNIVSNSLNIEFNNLEDIKQYINNNINKINEEKKTYNDFSLKKGDLIKGVACYERFLFGMLQNGINCKEFLGANAGGDLTNLDTDFSMILNENNDLLTAMKDTAAYAYGNLWIVIKNKEGRFNTTGDIHDKRMELFKINGDTGDNYGIRSGVPTTEIDYVICNNWDERVGFAIACSGIYIPVVDKQGKLLFTYDDFEKMKNNMQGLTYYNASDYKISPTMYKGSNEMIESLIKNEETINNKREAIYSEIDKVINSLGYNVLHKLDDDFTTNNMELIDTGSTSRGNNKPNDADFDFMLRMDSDIYNNYSNKANFVNLIEKKLKELSGKPNMGNNPPQRLRYTDVHFEGIDEGIEIDISFIQKTNKVNYTTDMCLIDRMNNIKEQNPDLYDSVRLNVIIAKSILKKAGIYKRVEKCLGGVGTENWVLQNGGSVIDAANSFLDVANTCSSFEEFKTKYSIFDFGSNFYDSEYNDGHDNFIYNLSEVNYNKMKETLIKFKNEYDQALSNGTLDEYISNLIGFDELSLDKNKII